MTATQKALFAFWSSFGVPCWLQDAVPDDAQLPYIVFDAVQGSGMDATLLTGTVWLRDAGQGANAQRAEILDRIAAAVGVSGVRLDVEGGGYMLLYRNTASFQRLMQDPEDRSVLGGRTVLEAHFYMA